MSTPRGSTPLYCAIALAAAASVFGAVAIQPVPTLIIPVLVSALPLLAPNLKSAATLRWLAAALLLAWVMLAAASVGVLYVPALAAMLVAASRTRLALA